MFFTLALAAIGVTSSIATRLDLASLPNIVLLVVGGVILDVLSQLAPRSRITEAVQAALYGVMYVVITCIWGILAAYALQRFAFPLRDQLLAGWDRALGFDWLSYAHWVDRHAVVQAIFHTAYDTIFPQMALPLLVFAAANRPDEMRAYLLAFAIAFSCTIVVSALMPAAGPIIFADRSTFNLLKFTGATPLDHLMRLRAAGPLVLDETPGGIATFPSFHATIAVLTPLTLRRFPLIFGCLLILDAAMLGGTLTEGAHYLSDVLAGSAMAFFAYAAARRVIRLEDRALLRRRSRAVLQGEAVAAA